jgi:hypothetical protein
MATAARIDLTRALAEDPSGMVRMLRVIYEPISFLHPSRLIDKFVDRATLRILTASRSGWCSLNMRVRDALRLSLECPAPLTLSRHGLFFEPPPQLHRLGLYAGATIMAEEIRRIVRRREREEILQRLGEDVYTFVLRKALFFHVGDLPIGGGMSRKKSLLGRVVEIGRRCITGCLNDLPNPLKVRFPLKFAANDDWSFPKKMEDGAVEALWKFLERLRGRIA